MKLIYDGQELEGGGGLSQEEPAGWYMGRLGGVAQNENESLSISLDKLDGESVPTIKLSADYAEPATHTTSKADFLISYEELKMSFEQIWSGEVFSSSGAKMGIGDISFSAGGHQ